jgi:hypothetical protein
MKKMILTFAAMLALTIGGTAAFAHSGVHHSAASHGIGSHGGNGGCVATQTCQK